MASILLPREILIFLSFLKLFIHLHLSSNILLMQDIKHPMMRKSFIWKHGFFQASLEADGLLAEGSPNTESHALLK